MSTPKRLRSLSLTAQPPPTAPKPRSLSQSGRTQPLSTAKRLQSLSLTAQPPPTAPKPRSLSQSGRPQPLSTAKRLRSLSLTTQPPPTAPKPHRPSITAQPLPRSPKPHRPSITAQPPSTAPKPHRPSITAQPPSTAPKPRRPSITAQPPPTAPKPRRPSITAQPPPTARLPPIAPQPYQSSITKKPPPILPKPSQSQDLASAPLDPTATALQQKEEKKDPSSLKPMKGSMSLEYITMKEMLADIVDLLAGNALVILQLNNHLFSFHFIPKAVHVTVETTGLTPYDRSNKLFSSVLATLECHPNPNSVFFSFITSLQKVGLNSMASKLIESLSKIVI